MKVTIVVEGKFHAFHLAHELERRGYLARIITGYPRFRLRDVKVPPDKIVSLPMAQLTQHFFLRSWRRVPGQVAWQMHNLFDRQAQRFIQASDLVVIWPDCCQRSLQTAHQLGAAVVIEAGSSHMLFRKKLLEEEYGRVGLKPVRYDPRLVQDHIQSYQRADFIATPSPFVARSFPAEGIAAGKVIYAPYGVDLSRFVAVPKEDAVFRVIFCGGISLTKGVQYLIPAFTELAQTDSELWLIGSVAAEMDSLLRYAKSNIRIRFLGRQPQSRLSWLYSQGNVFCLPSIAEGLAMVQAEAMACGLPLVCTTNTGGDALIEHNREGYIVPIRDVAALSDKLVYLYQHQIMAKQMGDAARQKVAHGFSWFDYGEKIISAYQAALAGQHAGGDA